MQVEQDLSAVRQYTYELDAANTALQPRERMYQEEGAHDAAEPEAGKIQANAKLDRRIGEKPTEHVENERKGGNNLCLFQTWSTRH